MAWMKCVLGDHGLGLVFKLDHLCRGTQHGVGIET
jgi:hypothetical protein